MTDYAVFAMTSCISGMTLLVRNPVPISSRSQNVLMARLANSHDAFHSRDCFEHAHALLQHFACGHRHNKIAGEAFTVHC
jgi:hypothetical protein